MSAFTDGVVRAADGVFGIQLNREWFVKNGWKIATAALLIVTVVFVKLYLTTKDKLEGYQAHEAELYVPPITGGQTSISKLVYTGKVYPSEVYQVVANGRVIVSEPDGLPLVNVNIRLLDGSVTDRTVVFSGSDQEMSSVQFGTLLDYAVRLVNSTPVSPGTGMIEIVFPIRDTALPVTLIGQ